MAVRKDSRIWEGYLYSGLSYAAMDEKTETINALTAYIKSSPGQPILSNAVKKQLTDLETDSGSLADALSVIEKAAEDQFENNYALQNSPNERNQCSGQFWWRYNKAPCSEMLPFTR